MSDALAATYITYRHMKTAGTYKIELEIPRENFRQMLEVLGDPPGPGETKWVAVTGLDQTKFEKP